MAKILIVEGRFYDKISDLLLKGAKEVLDNHGAQYEVVTVPGALEIPPAIKFSADKYDGFVALGCVMKGDTYHFEIVAAESARGITDLGIHYGLAIGNGILTVSNEEQAVQRAGYGNKGGLAAYACIDLLNIKAKNGR